MYTWTAGLVSSYYPTQDHEHDFIAGLVGDVIDGNTFELYVNEEDPENLYSYQLIEIVKIHGVKAPPLHSLAGTQATKSLAEEIEGKDIVCEIIGRDQEGNLIAIYNLD